MQTRRIHFGVCGIGFGHASRAATIIRALKFRGWEVSASSYGDGLKYFNSLGVEAKPVLGISYGILPEAKVSIKMTIYNNLLLPIRFLGQVACEVNYVEGVDVVVSDTRASTIVAGKLAKKPVLTILNQFNLIIEYPKYPRLIELLEAMTQVVGHIWGLSDKIVIADYPPPYTISKQNLVIPDNLMHKVEFVGPILERLPRDLPSIEGLREKYGIGGDGRPVVFYHATGPSYERRTLTRMILPILEKLSSEYEVVATLGGDSVEGRISEVKIFSWVEDPLELMKLSDVVICRSGQTTLAKALALGRPVIMIPIPAHGEQLGNAYSVAENGAGIILQQEDLCYESLKESIERALKCGFKDGAEKYSTVISDLNPPERVAAIIEGLVFEC